MRRRCRRRRPSTAQPRSCAAGWPCPWAERRPLYPVPRLARRPPPSGTPLWRAVRRCSQGGVAPNNKLHAQDQRNKSNSRPCRVASALVLPSSLASFALFTFGQLFCVQDALTVPDCARMIEVSDAHTILLKRMCRYWSCRRRRRRRENLMASGAHTTQKWPIEAYSRPGKSRRASRSYADVCR